MFTPKPKPARKLILTHWNCIYHHQKTWKSVPLTLWQLQFFLPFPLTIYSLKKLGHLYHRFYIVWVFRVSSSSVVEHVLLNLLVNLTITEWQPFTSYYDYPELEYVQWRPAKFVILSYHLIKLPKIIGF